MQIFVKGWEQDERLLSVAFHDIGMMTTSVRTFKNFILVGDVDKGVTFFAFQVRCRALRLG